MHKIFSNFACEKTNLYKKGMKIFYDKNLYANPRQTFDLT